MDETAPMVADEVNRQIQSHYGRANLEDVILAALQTAGHDPNRLTPEALAPIDEFHSRGRAATLELGRAVGLAASMRVLDVGCGVGGTARCLAQEFGCHVTGIDLTEAYYRAATMLTARTGLSALVDFRQGDATNLPFADDAFDVVWTEHASMNIPDKSRLYAEMHRVLRPGGTLAIHDILAGPSAPVYFPAPWARTPGTSFLIGPEALRALLEAAGFQITDWFDTTALTRAWFAAVDEKLRAEGLPLLGFDLLVGPDLGVMIQNQRRNMDEGRTVVAQILARKRHQP